MFRRIDKKILVIPFLIAVEVMTQLVASGENSSKRKEVNSILEGLLFTGGDLIGAF